MKNNFIILGVVALFLGVLTVSCSKYETNFELLTEDVENKENNRLNEESLEFKNSAIATLNKQKVNTKAGALVSFTKNQVEDLREKSLDMFASHGFKRSEFEEFLEEGDERIILMATIFTGIIEQEPIYLTPNRVKTKSEGGGDDGTCWDVDRLASCVGIVLGISSAVDAFSGIECVTKAVAKVIVKNIAKSIVGVAAASYTIYEFSGCMGWI